MQAIRQSDKRRGGLGFWNRVPGIKKTPHTRQPLTGVTLWGCVVGAVLLLGQVAFAHTGEVAMPTCAGLPSAADFFTADTTLRALDSTDLTDLKPDDDAEITLSLKPGDAATADSGRAGFYYGKVMLPTLTAGTLTLGGSPGGDMRPANAVLCRGASSVASSIATYSDQHTEVDATQRRATMLQNEIERAADDAGPSADPQAPLTGRFSVRSALEAARDHLREIFAVLERVDPDTTQEIEMEVMAIDTLLEDPLTDTDRADAVTALMAAATQLEALASALGAEADEHEAVNLQAVLASGDHTYVVVVAVEATVGATSVAALDVNFQGIMTTDTNNPSDEGRLTQTSRSVAYELASNAPGLFIAQTTGTAIRTAGTVTGPNNLSIPGSEVDPNVILLTPLAEETYTLTIRERDDTDRGAFGLQLSFGVAEFLGENAAYADTTLANEELTSLTSDYFFFTVAENQHRFLTVKTEKHADADPATDTSGYLYSQDGRITVDLDSALDGRNFVLEAPIKAGAYIIQVSGMAGKYVLKTESVDTAAAGRVVFTSEDKLVYRPTMTIPTDLDLASLNLTNMSEQDFFTLVIPEKVAGTLYVQAAKPETNGAADTVGVLFDPTGMQVAKSDRGAGMHFQITESVMTGAYTLQVYGKAFDTTGNYMLTLVLVGTDFLAALDLPTTPPPTDPTELAMACTDNDFVPAMHAHDPLTQATCDEAGFGGEEVTQETCEAGGWGFPETRIVRTGGGGGGGVTRTVEVEVCPTVETDARGYLESPAQGSTRSGVGLIHGWVCSANAVEVSIVNARTGTTVVRRIPAGYGSRRVDTVGSCDHDESTTGWGITYNFNHLPEGEYRIMAYADGERIGLGTAQMNTFSVVHLDDFAADDGDRFLRDLDGMCMADDFPMMGETTTLEWEEATQNFVITEVMMEGGDATDM